MNRVLTVAEGVAPVRLDVYLAQELGVTRSQTQRWIRAGHAAINGLPARAKDVPAVGDKVAITVPEASTLHKVLPDLSIVYEDADLIVINKPAGMSVHGGNGRTDEVTVADWMRPRTTDTEPERPGIVHRLDRETSGLLVLAKTPKAKAYLQGLWQDRQVEKTYQLLVPGRMQPDEAIINLPLDRDPAHPTQRRVVAGGRPATTRYQTLAAYPGYTYLEAYPKTGRTHQLRVHFAALGHPIAGDVVYGPSKRPLGLKRHFLHATRLVFRAPGGTPLDLVSPLPSDLEDVLSRLNEPYN